MSIIGKVGQKSLKVKSLNISIHAILIIGALTMIYPFMLMISFSFKSAVDNSSLSLIPEFLYNDEVLYQKYLESRYNEESSRLMDNYSGRWIAFSEVRLPENPNYNAYLDWNEFIEQYIYSVYDYYLSEHYGRGIYPYTQRQYRRLLRKENNNDISVFNQKYNTGAGSWEEIVVEEKDIFGRTFVSSQDGYLGRFREFKEKSPQWMRFYVNPDGAFVNSELYNRYAGDIKNFEYAAHASWEDVRLSKYCPPEGHYLREYWLYYVKEVLNVRQIGLQSHAIIPFRDMLKERYGNIQTLNITWNTNFESFSDVVIPKEIPDSGAIIEDLGFFVQNKPEYVYIRSIANDFRTFLQKKYNTPQEISKAWDTQLYSFDSIAFPVDELDYFTFKERKSAIRREFLWRNYAMALDQMFRDARSVQNTGIYVLLAILFAITVNPLAAYALSRFKPRFSYQIILLFMLTMAFPAMVMGIPNFLMLKRLNFLNTFWALVLPAAADGYFIFLLKGFFDSLPKELYESASLDGASEFRLFWQFTLYLSKPILAVISLGAFNAAYRNFIFAFIVCQDRSMWTLMVHIYELMQRASSGVGYAALIIASVPTLAVFIFFQNIIIEGIVIPMEK